MLQGNNELCHDLYSTASAFIEKLCLWKTQLVSGETTHFPTLSNQNTNGSFDVYNKRISNLIDEFERRVSGINSSLPLMTMFSNPMSVGAMIASNNFLLEFIDMQSDVELTQVFQSEHLLDFLSQVP